MLYIIGYLVIGAILVVAGRVFFDDDDIDDNFLTVVFWFWPMTIPLCIIIGIPAVFAWIGQKLKKRK